MHEARPLRLRFCLLKADDWGRVKGKRPGGDTNRAARSRRLTPGYDSWKGRVSAGVYSYPARFLGVSVTKPLATARPSEVKGAAAKAASH